jgi:hypothetical protein
MGVGDVSSPSPSSDNALVRFDGLTGKILQNSGAILDDSNNLTGLASLTVTNLVATTSVTTGDNLIILNDDVVGVPTEDAGLEINRGTSTDAHILWDETLDYWVAGLAGSTAKLLLSTDSTTLLPEGTNLYFTDERAQDAVGTILSDSSSIDFTYNDAGASISAVVLPGGVDHDLLLNFVSNEHVDHSSVSISAGTGLTGGGDITANRTLNLANTAVTAASYGSASQVGTFTVDAQGRLTAAANTAISVTSSAVSDFSSAAQAANGLTVFTATTTTTAFETIGTVVLSDATTYRLDAKIVGRRSPAGNYGEYNIVGLFYRDGGAAVQVGGTNNISSEESDGQWAARFLLSGNDVLIQAHGRTGAAETVNWKVFLTTVSVT